MKLITRCISALLFMGISLLVNASVEPTVSIRSQRDQSFSIHLKNVNNEAYNIVFRDKNGHTFLSEAIVDQNEYSKLYNLKNLPSGIYELKIENDRKIILHDIIYLKKKVTIDLANKKTLFKPNIRFHASFFDLNTIYFEEGSIKIKIWDKQNKLLFKKEITEKGNIAKRFDVTALPAGNYVVGIETSYYSVLQNFSIKSKKLRSMQSTDKQKKHLKKVTKLSETKQNQMPTYVNEAIISRIKWLQSQRN